MKFSLRLDEGENLTRANALACCSLNLVIPGAGSLLAGRRIGYVQLTVGLLGFGLTMIFGLKFLVWCGQHWQELHDPAGDPGESLRAIWRRCHLALAGLGIFGCAWLGAVVTNLGLLRRAPKPAPPVLR